MKGRVDALIATDVAARGIHVDGVACVLHFDPPEDEKTYLHRSGRTARAGATGVVVSLVRSEELSDNRKMQRKLGLPGEITAPGALSAEAPRARSERPHGGRKNGAPTGTVKFFDTRRGFGFIAVPGRDDLFVHHTNVTGSGGVLDEGEQVSFEIAQGRKGDEARNVRVV